MNTCVAAITRENSVLYCFRGFLGGWWNLVQFEYW